MKTPLTQTTYKIFDVVQFCLKMSFSTFKQSFVWVDEKTSLEKPNEKHD